MYDHLRKIPLSSGPPLEASKLLTDWGAGLLALYFFWKQELLIAVLVAAVPPLVVSGILFRFASLQHYATSRGQYIKTHMTRARELLCLSGYVVMAFAAWYHLPWMILSGLLVIVLAWFAVTPKTTPLA
jgi:hypothetical protein